MVETRNPTLRKKREGWGTLKSYHSRERTGRPAMWEHLFHLVSRSLKTTPALISGNWIAVFFTVFLVFIGGFLEWWKEGKPPMGQFFARWASPLKTGTLAAVIGWICLIGLNTALTIYDEHTELVVRNKALTNENHNLKDENKNLKNELANTRSATEPEESKDSLRRQTLKLVADLSRFWADRPMPFNKIQNPTTDEERNRNAAFDKYWRETTADYINQGFNQRVLGVVREYKRKGIPTGSLEQSAEQPERTIGAQAFGGFSLENCLFFASDLCQLHELAYHVDKYDQPIFLVSEQSNERVVKSHK